MFRLMLCNALSSGHAATRARMLHASTAVSKSLTDKVAEAADKVNKKMRKGLASAIEAGEKGTESAKESMGSIAEETKSKAEQIKKEVKHKADNLSHETRDLGRK